MKNHRKDLKNILIATCLVSSIIIPLGIGFTHYLSPIKFPIPLYDGYTDGLILYNPFKCSLKISATCKVGVINISVIRGSQIYSYTIACNSSKTIDVGSGTIFIVFRVEVDNKHYLLGENVWITVKRVIG